MASTKPPVTADNTADAPSKITGRLLNCPKKILNPDRGGVSGDYLPHNAAVSALPSRG